MEREYQYSNDHSVQHYGVLSDNSDFDDILNEDVASFYAGTQRSFDWGLSFNVSAKGEYYHNKYQHSWNFIPQLERLTTILRKAFSSSTSAPNAFIPLIGSCTGVQAISMIILL